jgi:hypothetical protein
MKAPPILLLLLASALPSAFSGDQAASTDVPVINTNGPVWCRFVPERKDDFAWENDHMAFRAYGPAIKGDKGSAEDSGIDCWLKRTTNPIVDEWYAGEQKGISYHKDHGDGYDPYHVGGSRGCGGTALWQDETLVGAGPYKTWTILKRTPSKCVFELTYDYPAKEGEQPLHEVKRFTVEQGKPFIRAASVFTRGGKTVEGLPVAVGVTTHDGKATVTLNSANRWASCWEVIDGYGLGTGVILAPGAPVETRDYKSSKKDQSHALLITKTDAAGAVTCYPGFAWVRVGRVASPADWEKILNGFSGQLHAN